MHVCESKDEYVAGACAQLAWTIRRLEEHVWRSIQDWRYSFEFKTAVPKCNMYEFDSE